MATSQSCVSIVMLYAHQGQNMIKRIGLIQLLVVKMYLYVFSSMATTTLQL